jgi:thioredoxin-related protein
MKKIALASLFVILAQAVFALRVGEPAPRFAATDSHGRQHSLAEYHGKFVVLEWHNQGCPYTKKHYDSGNMQKLQKYWTSKGIVWLTVISSAPGEQGYVTAEEENNYIQKINAAPTAVLLDPKGDLGHLYGAKTTPHLFVINSQGQLIYEGAIDDRPTTDLSDIAGATNYVTLALDQAMAGKPITITATRAYGCSVKYAK